MDPDYEEYKDASKFKAYVSDFASSLTNFEKAKEWADLIKCLQKVTAVFKKYSQFPGYVPEVLVFCKRLSQCCNPALPSGVHTKTLETYEMVFERLGPKRLAKQLPFYSSGLFPLFAHASMQIRPKILEIIKIYFLPLGKDLMPCLNGLVMAMVPGLEEQNSEHYKQIMSLLDAIGDSVSKKALFHALWKTVSLNPSIRIGAINYLMDRIPKSKSRDDFDIYIPHHDSLVLNALLRAIDDPQVLVQRAVLDLILVHFKLSENIFPADTLSRLFQKALLIQLRREVSLSRRVYNWMLGDDSSQSADYFERFSKTPLISALNTMFGESAGTLEKAIVPYKVLLALFDRPDISTPVINEILDNIITTLHRYSEGYSFSPEVIAQVNTVLDGLKPSVIWSFVHQFVIEDIKVSCSPPLIQLDPNASSSSSASSLTPVGQSRSLALVDTLLDKMVGLNTVDSMVVHLPKFIGTLTVAAQLCANSSKLHYVYKCVQLVLKVIGKLQQPIAKPMSKSKETDSAVSQPVPSNSAGSTLSSTVLLESIASFQSFYLHVCSQILPPIWAKEVKDSQAKAKSAEKAQLLSKPNPKVIIGPGASDMVVKMTKIVPVTWERTVATSILDLSGQCLFAFYSCFWTTFGIAAPDPSKQPLEEWFEAAVHLAEGEHPLVACVATRTLVAFLNLPASNPSASKLQSYLTHSTRLCQSLSRKLWDLMTPALSIIHYPAVSTFLELKEVCSDICEDAICEDLLATNLEARLEAHQKFALLWRLAGEVGGKQQSFNRALFLMLDSLNDDQPIIKLACRTWLADSIGKVERVLDPLLTVLIDKMSSRSSNGVYQAEYDCRRVLYTFKVLQTIIECDFRLWMHNAMDKPVSKDILERCQSQIVADSSLNNPPQQDSSTPPPAVPKSDPINGTKALVSTSQSDSSAPSTASPNPTQTQHVQDAFSFIPVLTYLDLLVVQSLRYIAGTPQKNASIDFTTKNAVVQTTAAGFLQFLLIKTTSSSKASELATLLYEPILEALAQSVCTTHLILQVNLLGLIRSIVLIDNAADSRARQPQVIAGGATGTSPTATANSSPSPTRLAVIDAIGSSHMFVQAISIGLLQVNTDFNVRFYWLDFITSCLPYLQKYIHLIVPPILLCLSDIISTHQNNYDSIESKDTIMILKSMKVILHYTLSNASDLSTMMNLSAISGVPTPISAAQATAAAQGQSTTTASTPSSFSGFFKTLFVGEGEEQQSLPPQGNPHAVNSVMESLDTIMKGLIKLWGPASNPFRSSFPDFGPLLSADPSAPPQQSSFPIGFASAGKRSKGALDLVQEFSEDELHNRYAVQDHILALFEMLYISSPSKFIQSLLQEWSYISRSPEQLIGANAMKLPPNIDPKLPSYELKTLTDFFESTGKYKAVVIDILNNMSHATADSLFKTLCDVLRQAHGTDHQRNLKLAQAKKRGVNFSHIQDASIADMVLYIVDWGTKINENSAFSFVNMLRTFLATHNPHVIFTLWKTTDIYLTKVGKSMHPRIKKELQLTINKLLEVGISVLNKTFLDLSSSWKFIFRYTDYYDLNSEPVFLDETMQQQTKSLMSLHMTLILRDHLVSVADKTYDDNRTGPNGYFTAIVHHLTTTIQSESIKNPHIAQESAAVLERLAAASNVIDGRTWRKEATDLFLYWQDFLRVSSSVQLHCFEKIVSVLFAPRTEDGSGWSEFVKYLSKSVAQQTIFVGSTEAAIQRALAVRRLAFILLSGGMDQYLDQLPLIQEKLVEALRQRDSHADTFAAVMLCVRVMLIKINLDSFRSFWPVVLAEMLGVFQSSTPEPELVFAVAKLLDLVLALPTEQFNIHEWIFISDPIVYQIHPSPPFIPYLDMASTKKKQALNNKSNLAPLTIHSDKSMPLVPINKLDASYSLGGMTWESFLAWLSKYSELEYENRVSTSSSACSEDVHSLLLADFALNKGLEISDWTVMKVTSDAQAPAAKEPPKRLSTKDPLLPQQNTPSTSTVNTKQTANISSAPPSPALIEIDDNANATLFGDVLD